MAGRGYSWFHGLNMGSLVKAPPYRIFEYMDELAGKRYPYSMVQVRYTVGGDNGPPDATLADTVRSWNEKYVSPRIVIATASEMFAELERRHGAAIPEVRGDFTGYWEDGAASTARETAMSRGVAGRLVQAEALWSIRGRDRFPAAKDEEAWREVVLFSEHTWGASDSVSNPDGEGPRAQWTYKKAFADRAERLSRELLEEAAASGAAGKAVDVFNTCSWARTDLVVLPAAMSGAGDLVIGADGAAVPSQRLRTGELAFVARDVPGFGAKRYSVHAGHGSKEGGAGLTGSALKNAAIAAAVDPQRRRGSPLDGRPVGTRELSTRASNRALAHSLCSGPTGDGPDGFVGQDQAGNRLAVASSWSRTRGAKGSSGNTACRRPAAARHRRDRRQEGPGKESVHIAFLRSSRRGPRRRRLGLRPSGD
jgi:hypothetical protein